MPLGRLTSFVRRHWPGLAVAACAVALYLPAVHFGFVFDDTSLVGPGGEPRPLGGWIPYRPLRYASYLLDYELGGSAAIYHLHNIVLHALAAALTTTLARRLGAARIAAFAGGLVVALHPIAVEAAAYVSGRRDLLCVVFGLAALIAQRSERSRAALVLLVASVASKESGLVFAAPLAAAVVTADGACTRALARLGVVTLAAAALVIAYGAVGPWLPGAGLGAFAHAGAVLVHYASGLAGAHALSPDYPALVATSSSPLSLAAAAFAVAALVLAIARCAQVRSDAEGRDAALVLAWTASTFAALAIWGGVHEPGADRHAYLVLPPLGVGLALFVTHVRSRLAAREAAVPVAPSTAAHLAHFKDAPSRVMQSARMAAAARFAFASGGAALALVAAVSTRHQMEIWRSDRTLWAHAVAQSDASPRAHANLARLAAADGDLALAQSHLAKALGAGGNDPLLLASRAALRCAQGRRPLAARDLRRARVSEPALVADIARDCALPASIRLQRPGKTRVQAVEASGK